MAFAYTVSEPSNATGRLKEVIVTFTNGAADTGGAIATGLNKVLHASITATGTTVATNAPVYSVSGGTVTIKTDADQDGTVLVKGY